MRARREGLLVLAIGASVLLAVGSCGDGGTEPEPEPQPGFGHIQGTVMAGGSGIQGATVLLNGGQAVVTDASGAFRYDSLAVGGYALTLQVPEGYELAAGQTAQRSVQVVEDQTSTVTWTLAEVDPNLVIVHLTSSLTFSPSSVTISEGQTVRWVNDAAITHSVTPNDASQPGAWSEAILSSEGQTFEHTFTTAGEVYDYRCIYHVAMTGQVTVEQ